MAKLSRKPQAERDAVASVIVVAGSSTSAEPSSASHGTVTRSHSNLRTTTNPSKDPNPAPVAPRASLTKRKHDETAQLPNKRPRLKNPDMGPAIMESGEDANVNPAVLEVMNRFKVTTRSASRAETPKFEVHLRSSKDMGGHYAIPPGKRGKPAPPVESPIPDDEDQGEPREGGTQPEPDLELEEDQEGEQLEDGDQPEAEADGEVEQPPDELFVKQTQPSQPVLKHIRGIARPTPTSSSPQLSKARSNGARVLDKIYDVPDDGEESVQVSSNPSSTPLQPKQTINNLQAPQEAPQVRRNVTRLPSKPWTNADDDGFGYPDEPSRAKKNDTAGGTSRKGPAPRPPVIKPPALAPPTRVQQKAAASRARRSPALEPARQKRPAPSPRGDPPPQPARIRPASIFGSDSAGESDTADETDEDADPIPDQPEVQMSGTAVLAMYKIMGRVGWTNRKKNWAKRLAAGGTELEHDAPGTTSLGRQMFKYLLTLNRALNKIPKAPYLKKQARYIAAHGAELKRMFFETNRLLTKIREENLAPIGESDRRANGDLGRRRAMVHDVLHHLIPMLVLIVSTTFSLGGVEYDAEGHPSLVELGTFTDVTLGYIVKISHWIRNLMDTLEVELGERPLEEDDSAGKKDKDRSRERFRDALDHWFMEFEEAQEAIDELATGHERRARQLEEDKRIKEARRREEERQEAETERRYQEWVASTQRMRHRPTILQEKWQRMTALSQRPTESASSGSTVRTLSREPPPAVVQYPPWPIEDREWLMSQLRGVNGLYKRHNNRPSEEEVAYFAASLQRPVEEVKLEIQAQKQAARGLAMDRGVPVEPWAV